MKADKKLLSSAVLGSEEVSPAVGVEVSGASHVFGAGETPAPPQGGFESPRITRLNPSAVGELRVQLNVEALVSKLFCLMRHDIQPRNGVSPGLRRPSCTNDLDVVGTQKIDHVSAPQGVVFLGLTVPSR